MVVSRHPFLSESWIAAAREIQTEFEGDFTAPDEPLRLNVTVDDAPFADGTVLGHIDTATGSIVPDHGHIKDADVAVNLPYATARELLVNQDPEALMIAFMSGELTVEGDVSRLLDLQDMDPSAAQQEVAQQIITRLESITE